MKKLGLLSLLALTFAFSIAQARGRVEVSQTAVLVRIPIDYYTLTCQGGTLALHPDALQRYTTTPITEHYIIGNQDCTRLTAYIDAAKDGTLLADIRIQVYEDEFPNCAHRNPTCWENPPYERRRMEDLHVYLPGVDFHLERRLATDPNSP